MKVIPDNSIDLIVTDPPYDIKNTRPGTGSKLCKSMSNYNNQIREANIVSGFDYEGVLAEFCRIQKNINIYIWCNKAQIIFYLDYFVTQRKCKFDIIKWVKTNAMPTYSNKYLTDTEYCLFFKKGAKCEPESYSDASTLYHAPINSKDKKLYGHPTIKPVEILNRLIRNSSIEGQTVLDPFMGSGSTGVSCKKLNRNFIGMENNNNNFDIACGRVKSISND
jgi:site-specific DNA-methyltransferase (adenine-specific)